MNIVDVKEIHTLALQREEYRMRPLVEPPPSLRCTCGGELQLKLIEPADRSFRKQKKLFICTDCSQERTFLADRNPYGAPIFEFR